MFSITQRGGEKRAGARRKRAAVQAALKAATRFGRSKLEGCYRIVRQCWRKQSDGCIWGLRIDRPGKARGCKRGCYVQQDRITRR